MCWGNLSLSKIIGGGTPHRRILLFCKIVYKLLSYTKNFYCNCKLSAIRALFWKKNDNLQKIMI